MATAAVSDVTVNILWINAGIQRRWRFRRTDGGHAAFNRRNRALCASGHAESAYLVAPY